MLPKIIVSTKILIKFYSFVMKWYMIHIFPLWQNVPMEMEIKESTIKTWFFLSFLLLYGIVFNFLFFFPCFFWINNGGNQQNLFLPNLTIYNVWCLLHHKHITNITYLSFIYFINNLLKGYKEEGHKTHRYDAILPVNFIIIFAHFSQPVLCTYILFLQKMSNISILLQYLLLELFWAVFIF